MFLRRASVGTRLSPARGAPRVSRLVLSPPRVYRRVNHCSQLERIGNFYLAVAHAFTANKHIALPVNTPNFRILRRARKTAHLESIYLSRFYAGHFVPPDRITIVRFIRRIFLSRKENWVTCFPEANVADNLSKFNPYKLLLGDSLGGNPSPPSRTNFARTASWLSSQKSASPR